MTTTIVTRAGKGSELTWSELDANFTNLKATADGTSGSWIPVVVPGSGIITSYSPTGLWVKNGSKVTLYLVLSLTNVGTAGGLMSVTGLPFVNNAAVYGIGIGKDAGLTGKSISGQINTSGSTLFIVDSNGGNTLWVNGYFLIMTVEYLAA